MVPIDDLQVLSAADSATLPLQLPQWSDSSAVAGDGCDAMDSEGMPCWIAALSMEAHEASVQNYCNLSPDGNPTVVVPALEACCNSQGSSCEPSFNLFTNIVLPQPPQPLPQHATPVHVLSSACPPTQATGWPPMGAADSVLQETMLSIPSMSDSYDTFFFEDLEVCVDKP
jgi:hypothetical protein